MKKCPYDKCQHECFKKVWLLYDVLYSNSFNLNYVKKHLKFIPRSRGALLKIYDSKNE